MTESTYEILKNDVSVIFGDGTPGDPMRFFEDKHNRFSIENYGPKGEWLGWKVEHLEAKEYFIRKLKGE